VPAPSEGTAKRRWSTAILHGYRVSTGRAPGWSSISGDVI